mmetsp:Transcript_51045/g.148173  ORF Transcript_51045/g.148173 Transcript_51045/m.148173 type:complete len:486 (+) Transcript_51045:117-1574(+)
MQKPGDWFCPSCNDLQFAKNQQCRKCGAANPGGGGAQPGSGGFGLKPGDWYCPACKDHQFARNARCNKCGEANPNPTNASGNSLPQKPGDWTCPSCGDLQFAKNMSCRRCGMANPSPGASLKALQEGLATTQEFMQKPGDWTCPQCGDLVFARNTHCRKCMTANPNSMVTGGVFSMLMGNLGGAGAPGGKGAGCGNPTPRTGDWFCPNCHDLQFARNLQCKRCGTPNPGNMSGCGVVAAPPTQAMMPGDWICPGCNDLVFARNDACRRCSTPRTAAATTAPAGQKGGGLMCLAGMTQPLTRPAWQLSTLLQAAQDQAEGTQQAAVDDVREQEGWSAAVAQAQEAAASATDHVYVKGLPENMTSDWLPKFIQMEDKVSWCKIVWARNGEAHALVQFDGTDSALWAVASLQGQVSLEHGTTLSLDFHRTRTPGPGKAFQAPTPAAVNGSWNCSTCGNLVFRRHNECQGCGTKRPAQGAALPVRSAPY